MLHTQVERWCPPSPVVTKLELVALKRAVVVPWCGSPLCLLTQQMRQPRTDLRRRLLQLRALSL